MYSMHIKLVVIVIINEKNSDHQFFFLTVDSFPSYASRGRQGSPVGQESGRDGRIVDHGVVEGRCLEGGRQEVGGREGGCRKGGWWELCCRLSFS